MTDVNSQGMEMGRAYFEKSRTEHCQKSLSGMRRENMEAFPFFRATGCGHAANPYTLIMYTFIYSIHALPFLVFEGWYDSGAHILLICPVPEKIHAHPMESYWKFLGGGGLRRQNFRSKV